MDKVDLDRAEVEFIEAKQVGLIEVISTPEQYETVAAGQARRKAALKLLDEIFDPHISDLFKAHKSGVALKAKFYNPLKTMVNLDDRKMQSYREEQRRIAQKKQDELLAAAKKKADDEQLALAESLQRDGHQEEAEMVLEETPAAPVVVVAPAIPETELIIRKTWKAEIVDASLLPRDYLIPNEVKINALARTDREGAKLPGVRFYCVETSSTRS